MAKKVKKEQNVKNNHQEPLPSTTTAIASGLIIAIIGSIMASNWERNSLLNLVGFGMLQCGIAVFILGIFGTIATVTKSRLEQIQTPCNRKKSKTLFRSIYAVGVGIAIGISGYILSSSYAKETILNYSGFGMLLIGIGVFVLGTFETARLSANIYVSDLCANKVNGFSRNRNILKRMRNYWHYMVQTRGLYNVGGIMAGVGLLFFSLWQLDLIVSGPVWWGDATRGWSAASRYADQYFQCFFWKTTIGEAYDTLFFLTFISFVVLFVSVFLWRWRPEKQTSIDESKSIS